MSARPDTWMPLWIGDYLADTMHLATDEHGAYMLTIFAYWRNGGPLKDDDVALARITRMTVKAWAKMRATIEDFYEVRDGYWHHKRIDAELAEAERNVAKSKARTEAATRARTQRNEQRYEDRNEQRNEGARRNVTNNVTFTSPPSPLPKESSSNLPVSTPASPADPPAAAAAPSPTQRKSEEIPTQNPLNALNPPPDIGAMEARLSQEIWGIPDQPTSFAYLRAWLAQGCDYELDILPTCRALVARRRAKKITPPNSLSYFTRAVDDARNARLAGTPIIPAGPAIDPAAIRAERVAEWTKVRSTRPDAEWPPGWGKPPTAEELRKPEKTAEAA